MNGIKRIQDTLSILRYMKKERNILKLMLLMKLKIDMEGGIDNVLSKRDVSLPILAIGLPSSSAFGNSMLLKFVKSTDEDDIVWRFYIHYNARCWDVSSLSNTSIRKALIKLLYTHFYNHRFKLRIEGSKTYYGK